MKQLWIKRLAQRLRPYRVRTKAADTLPIDCIFDSCRNGIVIVAHGGIVRCNAAFARMLGCSATDIVGRPFLDFVLPVHAMRMAPLFERRHDQVEAVLTLQGLGNVGPRDVVVHACSAVVGANLVISIDDVTDLRHSERAFREHARRLRILARQILDVQERERRHLARELHDEIGQELTLIKMCLERVGDESITTGNAAILQTAITQVSSLTAKVRSLSLDLRPSMLDDFGLLAALRWFAMRATAMADVRLELSLPDEFPRMSNEAETTFFRVAQEALNNLLKHAEATTVTVSLEMPGDMIELRVHDNGKGMDPVEAESLAAAGVSAGLLGMRERAALIGATLDIRSSPGAGCTIQLSAPSRRLLPKQAISKIQGLPDS